MFGKWSVQSGYLVHVMGVAAGCLCPLKNMAWKISAVTLGMF